MTKNLKIRMTLILKMIWKTVKGASLTVEMAELLPCAVQLASLILRPIHQVAEVLL